MEIKLQMPSQLDKCQSIVLMQSQNQYFYYLIDPNFQEVDRLFDLSFENNTIRPGYTEYFFPKVEVKDHSIFIDEINILEQPIRNNIKSSENIRKIAAGQDHYGTGCVLDYLYLRKYRVIAVGLGKQ